MKTFIAGKYINQGTYKSFQPENINKKWILDDMELLKLLSQADRQLGRLDMEVESGEGEKITIRELGEEGHLPIE